MTDQAGPFGFASTPHLQFGAGGISALPALANAYGAKVLLVTGAHSFDLSSWGRDVLSRLEGNGLKVRRCAIPSEPNPAMIDSAVIDHSGFDPHVVIAIGGGSVMDAGKAIAAMLPIRQPVMPFLEGVGNVTHPGTMLPFIAVPTTAGTGSEASKNAVLSETGENGYKKSLRHDNFVPDVALVDPDLTLGCPPDITAATGMDAFTQLLESYLSTAANPVTDALALEGLRRVSKSLPDAYHDGNNRAARAGMSLAAYLSGVTLANAGLGLVHGFASSIGGYFAIPHGVICSSLMAATNRVTVGKLRREKSSDHALVKYAAVGKMFCNDQNRSSEFYTDHLLDIIEIWQDQMNIPRLSRSGVPSAAHKKIVRATGNKNNPIALNEEEMIEVLEKC